MTVQKIRKLLESPERDFIYALLPQFNPRLCVDIGAAAGEHTLYMLKSGSDETRVVAFEPFPGNHDFFRAATKGCNVRLITKAASDSVGSARFVVPSTVNGTEEGWGQFTGYSSVGFLAGGSPRQRLKDLAKRILGRPAPENVLQVETTTIDAELAGETIDFMKMDVQGAEASVLRGSRKHLDAGKVHLMYIEWSGSAEVERILDERGYKMFDSVYVGGGPTADFKPFADIGFELIGETHLSIGEVAFDMLLGPNGPSPAEAMAAVVKAKLGWIQTDMIAVSSASRDTFHTALAAYAASGASSARVAWSTEATSASTARPVGPNSFPSIS